MLEEYLIHFLIFSFIIFLKFVLVNNLKNWKNPWIFCIFMKNFIYCLLLYQNNWFNFLICYFTVISFKYLNISIIFKFNMNFLNCFSKSYCGFFKESSNLISNVFSLQSILISLKEILNTKNNQGKNVFAFHIYQNLWKIKWFDLNINQKSFFH